MEKLNPKDNIGSIVKATNRTATLIPYNHQLLLPTKSTALSASQSIRVISSLKLIFRYSCRKYTTFFGK